MGAGKGYRWKWGAGTGLVAGILALLCLLVSCTAPPTEFVKQVEPTGALTGAGELKVVTWNLGYAGLGKDSDFAFDGGENWRPESRELVQANLAGIRAELERQDADVYLLQEVAQPSFVNRRVDVLGGVTETLADYDVWFFPDVRTRFLPPPLNIHMGQTVFTRKGLTTKAESILLPLEPPRMGGYRKFYQMVVVRIPTGKAGVEWVVGNVHLAAFDEGGDVRREQLDVIRDFALAEYQKGNRVVLGGDWNMRLVPTDFPHQTDPEDMAWVHDAPPDAFSQDWQVAVDAETPTVRTLQQPYVPGENYTCVIDGFFASPNARVLRTDTRDMGFQYSDHQPVVIRLGR